MPSKTQKNNRKTIIILTASVIILFALAFLVYRKVENSRREAQIQASTTPQVTSVPGSYSAQENPKNTTPTPVPTAQPGGNKTSLVPTITNYNGGSPVTVNVVLGQSGAGTCTITFSRAGQSDIVRSVSAVLAVNYYGCGFNLPRSDFSVGGEWTFTVAFSNDTYTGVSPAKTIVIQ